MDCEDTDVVYMDIPQPSKSDETKVFDIDLIEMT